VVARAALVLVEELADVAVIEESARPRTLLQQHVTSKPMQLATQPDGERRLKPALGGRQDLVWNPAAKGHPQADLLLRSVDLQARRQRGRKLHEPVIQQRRTPFERARHRGDVHLGEQIVREVRRGVGVQQPVEEAGRRRALPRLSDDVVDHRTAHQVAKVGRVEPVAAQALKSRHIGDVTPGRVECQRCSDSS
jgi:hypothetical protein